MLRPIAAIVAVAATACSGNVASSVDASTSSTQALLSVERSVGAGVALVPVRAHASAYFLRLQAGEDQNLAARLVGASMLLPPVGQCEPVEALGAQAMPLASLGPIDLVDVGEVSLEASNVRATLAARAFPDVVNLVSGVVYTTRDLVADPLPQRGPYVFKISGSQAIERMDLEARAPGPVEDLSIAGVAVRAETISLERADISLTWRPEAGNDLVYVELASTEDGPLERVRCTFPHVGEGVIPASALPRASAQSISVHLVHREYVNAPGLDAGEVRFDLSTNGTLRFPAATP